MAQMPTMSFMDFVQRFQALQVQRDAGDVLIKDLLVYCQTVETGLRHENARLAKELADAQLDLDDARRSRRDLQQKLSLAQQSLGQFNLEMNRNPYIIVLIDGDGMIFNEALVRQGIDGGKQAASLLRNCVLENCSELTDEIEIMAKVCANVTGLSKAMRRDGSLENLDDLKDFALGFTQGKASFDFIDVGHGKERADSKIKECMRWHLRNHNCKQILLGISHDAGYAPFLDEVVKPDDRCRITILEGPPTVRELSATGLQILNFKDIFRAQKLINRISSEASPPPTWAGVIAIPPLPSASPASVKSSGLAVKKPTALVNPVWVPSPRGLDPPTRANAETIQKIRSREKKLCNNHYLRGMCAIGDECCFEHKFKPTEEDLKAVAYLTRLNPCSNGQDCEQEDCIYGHHCPSVSYGKGGKEPICNAFSCRFGVDAHPPGCQIKNPRKERVYSEYF